MKYIEFYNTYKSFKIIDANVIQYYDARFDSKRLNEWQHKNYITKLINGWYVFNDLEINELNAFLISNTIRNPSYISLESVFSTKGLIPEFTFEIKAISTLKTKTYKINNQTFKYQNVTESMMFGYEFLIHEGRTIKIAHLEKAILDYLYLNSKVSKIEDFESLRWNKNIQINWVRLNSYLKIIGSKTLDKKIKNLKQYFND